MVTLVRAELGQRQEFHLSLLCECRASNNTWSTLHCFFQVSSRKIEQLKHRLVSICWQFNPLYHNTGPSTLFLVKK